MTELKIAEVILRERKKKNMTQEALAEALCVSAQAVSNWERGGYPDITLLPAIANFFDITVDELIGNDKFSKELEYSDLCNQLCEISDQVERINLASGFYRKSPRNYHVCYMLSTMIADLTKDKRGEYIPLLREVCEKIVQECTWQWCRQSAIRSMCAVCSDDEYEKWYAMCPDDYDAIREEVLEERFWAQEKWDESRLQFDLNNLYILTHFMFRKNRNWAHPERATKWFMNLINLIQSLSKDGKIPDGWLGKYANLHFRAACSSFGMGKVEEGYALLEQAFLLYEKWMGIPNGTALEVGDVSLFGGVKVIKNEYRMLLPDGEYYYRGAVSFFSDDREFMYSAMTRDGGWEWFDGVRNDARFKTYLERAKAYCENVQLE